MSTLLGTLLPHDFHHTTTEYLNFDDEPNNVGSNYKNRPSRAATVGPAPSRAQASFDWNPPHDTTASAMRRSLQINCFAKGSLGSGETARWMVPIDNTHASVRAFETCLRLARPDDHIVIIHAQEQTTAYRQFQTLPRMYREWVDTVALCKRYNDLLLAAGRPEESFTIIAPVGPDARSLVVAWAASLLIDTIVVGKHHAEDKSLRIKSSHWRSFTNYIAHNTHHKHHQTMRCILA
eukprot:TRINITY_DN7635_c0_g2_i1.p1 TRINITY_DN7635_c0_g2~~TRINITY_DN7635_c0_g2_i1.p1  ORF type:complete len:236 (-),score=41.42 TRINITY_DN7635_c0_g2_i1:46-753(-)